MLMVIMGVHLTVQSDRFEVEHIPKEIKKNKQQKHHKKYL